MCTPNVYIGHLTLHQYLISYGCKLAVQAEPFHILLDLMWESFWEQRYLGLEAWIFNCPSKHLRFSSACWDSPDGITVTSSVVQDKPLQQKWFSVLLFHLTRNHVSPAQHLQCLQPYAERTGLLAGFMIGQAQVTSGDLRTEKTNGSAIPKLQTEMKQSCVQESPADLLPPQDGTRWLVWNCVACVKDKRKSL